MGKKNLNPSSLQDCFVRFETTGGGKESGKRNSIKEKKGKGMVKGWGEKVATQSLRV